jgi:hypothetical protein
MIANQRVSPKLMSYNLTVPGLFGKLNLADGREPFTNGGSYVRNSPKGAKKQRR